MIFFSFAVAFSSQDVISFSLQNLNHYCLRESGKCPERNSSTVATASRAAALPSKFDRQTKPTK